MAPDKEAAQEIECARNVCCWRLAGDTAARRIQLDVILLLDEEFNRLTRKPRLHTLLRMMRVPATVEGLSSLQDYLEAGFDAFADMHCAHDFLTAIRLREAILIRALYDDERFACKTKQRNLFATNVSAT